MSHASMGIIGIGTMGGALALNIAENGYDVALWNRDMGAVDQLIANAGVLAPGWLNQTILKPLWPLWPRHGPLYCWSLRGKRWIKP